MDEVGENDGVVCGGVNVEMVVDDASVGVAAGAVTAADVEVYVGAEADE